MKKKIFDSYEEFEKHVLNYNKENNVVQFQGLDCGIIFASKGANKGYSKKSRTYLFKSGQKWFLPSQGGTSWYATNADGTDRNVRLDWYRHWEVEQYFVYI